jgi:putative transposase
VTDNTGRCYDFIPAEKTKLLRRDKKRTDLQIKLARQKKGSRRRSKTKKQTATTYARDSLRTAVAHRISNHLVVQAVERGCAAIGFEDLRLGNMAQRARPKSDPLQPQHYLQWWCGQNRTQQSTLGPQPRQDQTICTV